MLATVRNRRGIVASVNPFDGDSGRIHLVHIEYNDHGTPTDERLLWELEPGADLEEPNALPNVAAADAMPAEDFDALLRAARWTALSPYLDPDGDGPLSRQPVASPFHGGVRVEDYQLVPLLKALRMPRVSLLIADDVGLGKTIEAGLVLQELLLRRRIQRVLILTPASLRLQWRDELREKFSLSFDVVDRRETDLLRRRLGIDANPWRSFSRIVASYHYLRQPDVREQFLSACRTPEGSPHLPWDLLIVDECHNLMPSPYGEDSELCRMLAAIAPCFEHKLFLSATPHNGHTRSFTGLLELLDPVRFSRTNELTQLARRRIGEVFVRRLKRDINAATQNAKPHFCTRRSPVALELKAHPAEAELSQAFDAFRTAVRSLIASGTRQRRRAGAFAVEILGKRLLSCPTAFAESWRRARQGFAEPQAASESEMAAAERSLRQETGDDREAEQRGATAATVTGAWLKQMAGALSGEIQRIERALATLGFDLDGAVTVDQTPLIDARFDALTDLIERLLLTQGEFRDDERLIVFTEYKTTLDYLSRRLCECYAENRILTLFGAGGPEGMDESDREKVKTDFNDPVSGVRILVATDAASEGLNLQRTARYLLHFDCPWNPSRLEQRNGRLDRYGQARDVTIHHFVADQDPDIRFLDHVIRKADEIREDLGAVNEIFDRAVHRRLIEGADADTVVADLDRSVAATRRATALETNTNPGTEIDEVRQAAALATMADEIDLEANALRDTLEAAMAIPTGRPQLEVGEERGVYRVKNPGLSGWNDIIDEAVRLPVGNGLGPVPGIAFDPAPFIEQIGELSVFSPRRDALLMHLAHPMMKRALAVLSRCRYASAGAEMPRWTVRHGDVPRGADALVLLSIEELAVNELRETFHRWVRTVALPVRSGCLDAALPHTDARSRRGEKPALDIQAQESARDIFADIEPELKNVLRDHHDSLTAALRQQLEADGERARRNEDERYRQRQGEVSELIQQTTVRSLEREVQQLQARRAQGELFEMEERQEEIDQSIEKKQEEIALRKRHYEEIRQQLAEERRRILERLLPARYTLAGTAQAFPVAVEILLPEQST